MFVKFLQLKSFGMAIRVSHKIDLLHVHWEETEFSLYPPLTMIVPLFR